MAHLLSLLLHNSHRTHKIEQILFSLSFFPPQMTDLGWNWSQQVGWFGTDSKEGTNVQFSKALQKPNLIPCHCSCGFLPNIRKLLRSAAPYKQLWRALQRKGKKSNNSSLGWSMSLASGLQYRNLIVTQLHLRPCIQQRCLRWKGLKGVKRRYQGTCWAVSKINYVLKRSQFVLQDPIID